MAGAHNHRSHPAPASFQVSRVSSAGRRERGYSALCARQSTAAARAITSALGGYKELSPACVRMSNLKAKFEKMKPPTAKEAAEMDASIRENKRSVVARALVNAVRDCRARGMTPEEIEKELADQKAASPRLFAMVLDPGHSEAMLNAMLAQLEAVEAGAATTHNASVVVGTMLVNSFVRPKLGMEQVPLPDSAQPRPLQ